MSSQQRSRKQPDMAKGVFPEVLSAERWYELPSSKRRLLYAGLFGLSCLLVFAITLVTLHIQARQAWEQQTMSQESNLRLASQMIVVRIQAAIEDLHVITQTPLINEFIAHESDESYRRLAENLLNFVTHKGIYNRVRFVDERGRERLRIDLSGGRPRVVEREQLLDQTREEYFHNTQTLHPDEVYVSHLDLETDQGVVTNPFTPLMSMAMAVYNREGERRGILVLEYLAQRMLDDFAAHFAGERAVLLNPEGYWLLSPEPELAWGFRFDQQVSFARRHPEAWATIHQADHGQVVAGQSLYLFNTIYPLASGQVGAIPDTHDAPHHHHAWQEFHWKGMVRLPAYSLTNLFDGTYRLEWGIMLVSLMILAYLEWQLLETLCARYRDKRELAEQVQRLHEITDTLAEGVYVVNTQGIIEYVNHEACRLLGYSRAHLLGKSAHRLFHHHRMDGSHLDELECPIMRTTRNSDIYINEEELFWRQDGSALPVSVRSTGVVRRSEGVVGAVVAFRDVSVMQESARELTEARKRADAANQAKSNFLANMSYELRTPLNAVLGYSRMLLKESNLNHDQHSALNAVQHAGEYLLQLINDVLDLSRIEAGRMELVVAAHDVHELIAQVAEQYIFRARQKGLQFHLRGIESLPRCLELDEQRLRQVLQHLLSNAVKFTPRGEVTLEAGYRDGTLQLVTRDTGIGIDDTQLPHLFIPYGHAGDAKYKRDGSGLGLALSRLLIERMGGQLKVESRVDEGSRFELSLPAPQSSCPSSRERSSLGLEWAVGYNRTDHQESPFRILVVDDQPDNRAILSCLLEPLGFLIDQAEDGPAALEHTIYSAPDLVLMDLVMPQMDGLTASRKLHELRPHLPIIAVSARAFDDDREQCRSAGCAGHISKPVEPSQLLALLEQQLPLSWRFSHDEGTEGQPLDLTPLTLPLREELRAALMHGNPTRLNQALEHIEQEQPKLALQLRNRVERYAFQSLLDHLDRLD